MTYLLAAPHLYKEAVIGSFESFFKGFDRSATALCPQQAKQAEGGNGYGELSGSGLDAPSIDVFHKRALLRLVEAVHIVYTPQDATLYHGTHSITVDDEDGIFEDLIDQVDVSRYMNLPVRLKGLPLARVLPNLGRAMISLWCRDTLDESHPFGLEYDNAGDCGDFHRHLASKIYQFAPKVICRTAYMAGGILDDYPTASGDIEVNILHEPFEGHISPGVVPGAKNIIHVVIDDNPHGFAQFMVWNYGSVVERMREWLDDFDTALATVQNTDVTFVIHHPYGSVYDNGNLATKEWFQDITNCGIWLRGYIANHDPYPEARAVLEGWDNWKIIPEEEYPYCPACQPEEYRIHQNSKIIASPSSA
jgi:hypothetical protein